MNNPYDSSQTQPVVPSKDENPQGLHQRYKVTPAEGSDVDPTAIYFVLRLDSGGKDPVHIDTCRKAAAVYATIAQCHPHLAQMAQELAHLIKDLMMHDSADSSTSHPGR